ncbi:uncharacterized protein LOC133737793 [Rosa rugosa]|uniref:uncharacterized protein LOC133737793 n=1 Tax=Rosa rugosa TaxID=74645 RepID=UPI002B412342|nr:uncharacterized protein LOC133737793 [Rosa rugosa]
MVCSRDEDLNHLFFSCPFAANVWRSAAITNTDFQNFEEWFLSWFRKDYQKSTTENLLLLCWKIWKARNNLIFRHSPSLPNMVVHAAASIGENYRRNNPCRFKGPAFTSQVIRWLPPPAGFAKLNFDGSVVNNKKAAAGFVIRDHDGSPLFAGARAISHASVPIAEGSVVRDGLYHALLLNCRNIYVEGDSKLIIDYQQKMCSSLAFSYSCERHPESG